MKKLYFALLVFVTTIGYSQQPHKVSVQSCLKPFYHGVASGDPLSDRVIIWTRVTPDTNQINQSIVVNWRVATDTGMTSIVNNGTVLTDSSADFTVKVDVTALNPNTVYYYEFQTGTYLSPRGRTKTNPVGANVDSLRFAIVSCANYEAGWFNVYASLLQRQDFDAVICLGDYIYEYNTGGYSPNPAVNRQWSPANEIVSVADYRMRYSTYRLDDDLQRLHQQFPFIVVYDDHEFTNDAWMNGAQNHTPATEGPWSDRKAMAYKAYFEWMPIRQVNVSNPNQIYRGIKYGDLVELMMLDTRIIGRDVQAGTSGATVTSNSRQLLGTTQYSWLTNELSTTTCKWKVLGQQVMMARLQVFGIGFNGDQWDGYPAERNRVFNHVLTNNISNMVVITGDIHSSWANDLPTATYNSSTGAGSAGVEFVTPSVTSPGASIPGGASVIQAANGHIKYCDLSSHGYVIMDINQARTQADWFNISTIDNQSPAYSHVKSFKVNNLQRFLISTASASLPRTSIYSTFAPLCPRTLTVNSVKEVATNKPIILSAYPNPVNNYLTIQIHQSIDSDLNFGIYDVNGKLVKVQLQKDAKIGVNKYYVPMEDLSSGVYFLKVNTGDYSQTLKFVKN
jgi:alkaline phosphatase D